MIFFKVLISIFALFFSFFSYAESVYSWKDDKGVTHYSTNPSSNPNAKIKDLPVITKADVKVVKQNFSSCAGHGGIDCQAGADSDGSVICYDGFTGALTNFRSNCNSPKLEINEITEMNSSGSFTVIVRNIKSIEASAPSVTYKTKSGAESKLIGPPKVDPFGIAEFRHVGKSLTTSKEVVARSQLKLGCANCTS